jgi:phosphomannomutase
MVTASHLPFDRNGLKLFTRGGGLSASTLAEVIDQAVLHKGVATTGRPGSWARAHGFLQDVYGGHLEQVIRGGLGEQPLHVVVNAGNGAGGFFANVLRRCGIHTAGSLYLQPDGRFPHHPPNPENAVAMEHTRRAVLERGADLGVVFDTDVDR